MATGSRRADQCKLIRHWWLQRSCKNSQSCKSAKSANIHQFVIDSAASFGLSAPQSRRTLAAGERPGKHLLLFSASHPDTLKTIAENSKGYLREHPERLRDLSYTLAERREHLKLRSYSVVTENEDPHFSLSPQAKIQGPRRVAFVFTGQGAQWYVTLKCLG